MILVMEKDRSYLRYIIGGGLLLFVGLLLFLWLGADLKHEDFGAWMQQIPERLGKISPIWFCLGLSVLPLFFVLRSRPAVVFILCEVSVDCCLYFV